MKAISLTQPWATLIAIGAKRIETRSFSTSYRGPIAIHAAKGLGPVGGMRGLVEQCQAPRFHQAFIDADLPSLFGNHENPFPLGAIVATANLVHCLSTKRPIFQDECWQF
jgi:activating signal cointegrator 1